MVAGRALKAFSHSPGGTTIVLMKTKLPPSSIDSSSTPPAAGVSDSELLRRSDSSGKAIVTGLVATVAFYIIAQNIPGLETFVFRYFCSHPVCYASTAMFFVGLSILMQKRLRIVREKKSLAEIDGLIERSGSSAFEGRQGRSDQTKTASKADAEALSAWVQESLQKTGVTALVQRMAGALGYVRSREDGSLDDHLRYLADLASERLQQSYALIRTITWAIPIMGFLGTVLGITIAIANITPEQLESSLPAVTAGLAVAFDTTAQALAMSTILVFGAFLTERAEQQILNEVEQFGIDHLGLWLSTAGTSDKKSGGATSGIQIWTEALLQEQTESWSQHLSSLQSSWIHALASQSERLSSTLMQETDQLLQGHRESTTTARDVYSEMLQQSAQMFAGQMQRSLELFAVRVESWQNALQTSALASAAQAEELHRFGRTLLELTESEHRLTQMQQLLNDNLQSLQVVETLEQTVSSLNAAVHVLTAKTSHRAAA